MPEKISTLTCRDLRAIFPKNLEPSPRKSGTISQKVSQKTVGKMPRKIRQILGENPHSSRRKTCRKNTPLLRAF
jgi:hypothetical protein